MELSTSYFATCTKAEVLLLEELAQEHRNRLRLKHVETPHSLQIVVETDSRQLRDYIYFMLQRLRSQQHTLEVVYNGEVPDAPPTHPEMLDFPAA